MKKKESSGDTIPESENIVEWRGHMEEFQIIDNVLDVAAKLKNELAIKEERLRNEKICNLFLFF